MTNRIKWNVPEGEDPRIADELEGGGRAEVIQPGPEPIPNPLTIEGQIAQYGIIAQATKDKRDPVRRWSARTYFAIAFIPILGSAVALAITAVVEAIKALIA